MSVASEEADLISRKKESAGELYAYLDLFWNTAVLGERPKSEDLLAVEELLERIDGR